MQDDDEDASCFARALDAASYCVFGGCGYKGVAYLGALQALQTHRRAQHAAWHRRLRGTCGSSSGCIAALAFLVDADAEALLRAWKGMEEQVGTLIPHVNFSHVMQHFGADDGGRLKRLIREVLALCGLAPDTTFAMLHRLTGRDLSVCVTNLSRGRVEVCSHRTTPDVAVADAVYWSMTVPFAFAPEQNANGDLMADGCLLAFVPTHVFPIGESVVWHAVGVNTGAVPEMHRRIDDLHGFGTAVMACCALSMLSEAREQARRHPERYVEIIAPTRALDALLHIDATTFDSLTNLGFATTLVRLFPAILPLVSALTLTLSRIVEPPPQHA